MLRPLAPYLLGLHLAACSESLEERFRSDDRDPGEPIQASFEDYSIELLDLDLKDVLARLEEAFEARDADACTALVTAGFRGSSFDGLVSLGETGTAHLRAGSPSERYVDGKEELQAALADYFAGFEQIHESHFKLKEYQRGRVFARRADARLAQDLRGRRADGAVHQEHASWRVSFARTEAGWLVDRLFLVAREQESARAPLFTEVTTAAGLLVEEPPELTINGVGNLNAVLDRTQYDYGGLALTDVDGDGFLDVFLPDAYGPSRLFVGRGDGTFSEEAAERGIRTAGRSRGAVFGDVDNDGDPDLFVACGPFHHVSLPDTGNQFFENLGGGRFRETTEEVGLSRPSDRGAAMTPVFLDYDVDGDLDLFVANYGGPSNYARSAHHPFDAKHGDANLLYRNEGDGTFVDVSGPSGMAAETRFSYAVAVCDWNLDGLPDVYVANDFGPNQLYVNVGDGTFEDRAAALGVEDVGNGMGAAFADADNDGTWDLYVTNMQSTTGQRVLATATGKTSRADMDLLWKLTVGNTLYQGIAGPGFAPSSAIEVGVANCGWAWHGDFVDVDADADQDLFVVNGYFTGVEAKDC